MIVVLSITETKKGSPVDSKTDLHSTQKCNEFAAFYTDKIEGIRHAINISTSNKNVGTTTLFRQK